MGTMTSWTTKVVSNDILTSIISWLFSYSKVEWLQNGDIEKKNIKKRIKIDKLNCNYGYCIQHKE